MYAKATLVFQLPTTLQHSEGKLVGVRRIQVVVDEVHFAEITGAIDASPSGVR
jgi:hypothetical protein